MTTIVNDDLNIPVPPLRPAPAVLIVAEHNLADVAMVALVQRFGHRAAVVDLDAVRSPVPVSGVVIVRSVTRRHQIESRGLFRGARFIGVGVGVVHLGGVELSDSPFAAGSFENTLAEILGKRISVSERVHLSRREHEVVAAYTLGATVRETAIRHFISESTVRSHFRRVMRRYADAGRPVNNKTQLLLELIADGWVERRPLVNQAA